MTSNNINLTNLLKLNENSKLQVPSWLKTLQSKVLDLDFYELVKNISESKSRDEETRIIHYEVAKLRRAFSQRDQSSAKKRECLVRMIYCHMLGYNVEFGHVHALNMTQDQDIWNKRTGYLALSLCLPEKHELLIMAVNSIQKGLLSSNYLETSSALTALSKLIDRETIPAFMSRVLQLITHQVPIVRRKAVTALHRFYTIQGYQDTIDSQTEDKLRIALCDRDPSVMAATVAIFLDISKTNPHSIKNLVPSFVGILKQVAEGRLPPSYIYHNIHHPWLQINLLKLLSNLGAGDQRSSEHMYQVILLTMQQSTRVKNNASFGILYESIKCLTSIYPNLPLIEASAKQVHALLPKIHNNLRYFGIKALTSIVKVSPKSVTQFQMEVIECLESTDDTLKRKSLDLLYRMTNANNIVPICAKLVDHIRATKNEELRSELVSRQTELMEKYSPSDYWYIDTMTTLLSIQGSNLSQQSAFNLIRLLAEGNQDTNEDIKIKLHAVSNFIEELENQMELSDHTLNQLPDTYIKVMSWVLSEYAYLIDDTSVTDMIINYFCDLLEKDNYSSDTKSWILIGLTKLTSQKSTYLPQVSINVKRFTQSRSLICQQRALELHELSKHPTILSQVYPKDSYCEEVDHNSLFNKLGKFVSKSIENGQKDYIPRFKRKSTPLVDLPLVITEKVKELNFEYPPPPTPSYLINFEQPQHQPQEQQLVPISNNNNQELVIVPDQTPESGALVVSPRNEPTLVIPKSNKISWTKKGFVGDKSNQPVPPPQLPQNTQVPQPTQPTQPEPKLPTPQPQPVKKQEADPEKVKLAQQLFSGLGPEPVNSNNNNEENLTPNTKKGGKKYQTKSNQIIDPLLELNTITTNTNKSPQKNSILIDLENDNPQINQTQNHSNQSNNNNSLLDTFDDNEILSLNITSPKNESDLETSAILPIESSPQVQPQNFNTILPTITLSSQINLGSDFSIENLNLSPILSKYIDKDIEYPYQQVYKDKSIQVGVCRANNIDLGCNFIVLITNLSTTKIDNFDIQFTPSNEHLNVKILDFDPIFKQSETLYDLVYKETSTFVNSLTTCVILQTQLKKIGFNMSIPITITQNNKPKTISIPIEISDYQVSFSNDMDATENFKELWEEYQNEREIEIEPPTMSTIDSRQQFIYQRLVPSLHLAIVNSQQDNDNYYFVNYLKTNNNNEQICLYHFQYDPVSGISKFSIKTSDKNLSDVVYRYCFKLYNLELISLQK